MTSTTNYNYHDDANYDGGIDNNPSSLLTNNIEAFSADNIITFDNYCEQLYINTNDGMNSFRLEASSPPILTKFVWTPELVSIYIIDRTCLDDQPWCYSHSLCYHDHQSIYTFI